MTANAQDSFGFNHTPPRQCDLVMKGGITSGVVYPPAVLELQQTFRFRCIGGTSAGAIAAAVTAAAELGRETGGFERLDALRRQLASPGFLFGLFKPAPGARGAFGVLTDLFLRASAPPATRRWRRLATLVVRVTRSLARHFRLATWLGRVAGAMLGAVPAALILLGVGIGGSLAVLAASGWGAALGVVAAVGIVAGAWLVGLASGAWDFARTFTSYLPNEAFFGLCPGYLTERDRTVLTTWLTDQIDALAGRGTADTDDPLTFVDLAGKTIPGGTPADIMLRVVTSNLSHGQPYVFPLAGHFFLFREDDMARLFPARVVRYLKKAGTDAGLPLPPGYLYLPPGDQLPVVFATRLSLSFPVLLSAVRLYTIKPRAFAEFRASVKNKMPFQFDPEKHFQENWFSDGGISSNFPIHFFDAWLPSRPTFGINLADVRPEAKTSADKITPDQFTAVPDEDEPGETGGAEQEGDADIDDVFLPAPREGAHGRPQWRPIGDLPSFLMSAFDTARNYRDTMQAMLPSYRERVVQVRLTPQEGGLNLAMDAATIQRIGDKGRRAGEKLAGMDFEQHQWVRFRVLMAYLEMGVQRMRANFPDVQQYQTLFSKQLAALQPGSGHAKWYRPENDEWCAKAAEKIGGIVELGARWEQIFFGRKPPKPEASLRVTPPL